MIEVIHNYLKLFITEHNIPLAQVLTESDLHQLSVALNFITTGEEVSNFNNINNTIFENLGNKKVETVLYPIKAIPFTNTDSVEEELANIALLGYYCFMYFYSVHDLPIERVLFVVNTYMKSHIVDVKDTATIDCTNPISNLVSIGNNQYIRTNGKHLLPPTASIKEEFIKQLNSLLIK